MCKCAQETYLVLISDLVGDYIRSSRSYIRSSRQYSMFYRLGHIQYGRRYSMSYILGHIRYSRRYGMSYKKPTPTLFFVRERYKKVSVALCAYEKERGRERVWVCVRERVSVYMCARRGGTRVWQRGGGLGSRPKKMYGERLGDGVEYHLMKPTPSR